MTGPTPQGRPHDRLTEDGRRLREILSYARRGSRLTPRLAQTWAAHHEQWVIPLEALDDPGFDARDWFGHVAPMILEIGSGVGEATVALAAARPAYDVLALEVWRPGVAATLQRLDAQGVDNVRLCEVDAAWFLEHRVAPGALSEVWTFFPDPWPKKRHHKRRLVTPGFASLVASRLAPGGWWRLATDWADYAEQMLDSAAAEPTLRGGVVPRWADRPTTKFERKGIAAERAITDLAFQRS